MRYFPWLLFVGLELVFCASLARADEPAKPAADKDKGPVACWKFDEGTGETAKDSAGKNDGKLVNVKWVDGKVGKAIELSGSNSYVEVPDAPALNPTGATTIEAWVKHKGKTFKDWEAILAKGDNTYRLHLNRDKHGFDLGINGGGYDLTCDVVPEADEWYFVVGHLRRHSGVSLCQRQEGRLEPGLPEPDRHQRPAAVHRQQQRLS